MECGRDILSVFLLLCLVELMRAAPEDCRLIEKKPPDPNKADLLARLAPLKGTVHSVVFGSYKYAVSICGGAQILKGDNTSVGAVRFGNDKTSNTTTIIGRYNLTDITSDGDKLMVMYSGGDRINEGYCNGSKWATIVTLFCDVTVKDVELTVLDDSLGGCWPILKLRSRAICKKPEPMGKTTVIVVLLLTGILCYLAVGFAYRRIVVGAKGMEQIPNYRFWCQVCSFLCIPVYKLRECWTGREWGRRDTGWGRGGGGSGTSAGGSDTRQYTTPDDPLLP